MTAGNFEKINLLEVYNTSNKFNVICLSESYLDSSVASDNDDLNIIGYNLYTADHPKNVKRGGVCVYIRESLPVRCLSNTYLQECLILEISINNKKGYVLSLYRSPSQTPSEFDSFINNLEKLIIDIYSRKADFAVMIGDFNAKSCNWSINDTTNPEGAQLDSMTSLHGHCVKSVQIPSFFWSIFSLFGLNTGKCGAEKTPYLDTFHAVGMKQLISEPSHILHLFTDQPNIDMGPGVDSSLHSKCHNQIIYSKLNLKIDYPPLYIRKIWNSNRAETDFQFN